MTAAASRMRSGKRARPAGGFTYVGLIILVAIIALVGATTVRLGVTLQRAQAERDLLHIGEEFSNALKSYADATKPGQPQQPPTLKELLRDPRFPGTRRHLRKIFVDPMTGRAQWGIVYLAGDKGVLGIYSLSTAKPIKVGNFPSRFQAFGGKDKISEWVFTFDGQPPLLQRQSGQSSPGKDAAVPTVPAPGTSRPPAGQPPALPEPVETEDPVDSAPVEPAAPEPEPIESAEPVEPEPAAAAADPDKD